MAAPVPKGSIVLDLQLKEMEIQLEQEDVWSWWQCQAQQAQRLREKKDAPLMSKVFPHLPAGSPWPSGTETTAAWAPWMDGTPSTTEGDQLMEATGADSTTEDGKTGKGGGDYVLGTELLVKKAKMGRAFESFSRLHAYGQHDVYEGGADAVEATKTTLSTASKDLESFSPAHAYGPHDEISTGSTEKGGRAMRDVVGKGDKPC